MKLYKSFETDRLLLRPTGVQDAPFIFRLMNSPGWLQFIGDRQIVTEQKAADYIRERMLPQLERLGYGNYTVLRKSDQELLGSCGLYDREGLPGIDIGFAFLPEYAGQGYAYESVSCLLNTGVREFGLLEIKAITNKDNLASQKLLRKLGMRQTGTVQLTANSEELLLFIFK